MTKEEFRKWLYEIIPNCRCIEVETLLVKLIESKELIPEKEK